MSIVSEGSETSDFLKGEEKIRLFIFVRLLIWISGLGKIISKGVFFHFLINWYSLFS